MTELAELDEIVFGAQRIRRASNDPVRAQIVRELGDEDIPLVAEGTSLAPVRPQPGTLIAKLKHSHHQVAQLIAAGESYADISLVTGYHPTYIGSLTQGQEFQELIAHYSGERKRIFDTTLERMKALGIASLEKLQDLLDNEEEKWTKRELMEMAELMLVKPGQGKFGQGQGGYAGNSGVVVNVKFVAGKDEKATGPVIEGNLTPEDGFGD